MKVYSLYIQPYYDRSAEQYINIITINKLPSGPLADYVTNIRFNKLSDYFGSTSYTYGLNNLYVYAIKNINNGCNNCVCELLRAENIDDFIGFLIENNYTVNKDLTKIMGNDKIYLNNGRKLLFYINYSD